MTAETEDGEDKITCHGPFTVPWPDWYKPHPNGGAIYVVTAVDREKGIVTMEQYTDDSDGTD